MCLCTVSVQSSGNTVVTTDLLCLVAVSMEAAAVLLSV